MQLPSTTNRREPKFEGSTHIPPCSLMTLGTRTSGVAWVASRCYLPACHDAAVVVAAVAVEQSCLVQPLELRMKLQCT